MLKLPQKFLAMVRDLQSPTVLLVVSMALVLEWQVTLGMVLAMLVELYMAIPHSDMERGLLMLMPTTAAMAMEDMHMDPPMAMDTDVDISMVKITLPMREP